MSKKFSNLHPIATFTRDRDPFRDRRGKGPLRPKEPISHVAPNFHGPFDNNALYFAWLGHASVFLHMHGKNILIDPVLSKRSSPVSFLGPRRFPGPVPSPADFPAIDLMMITHNHYDHMDRATILSLDDPGTQYVTPSGVGRILHQFGIPNERITELNWYESCTQDGMTVFCTPSQHNSARALWDSNQTLWGSFVLKDDQFTVFDTGDGGFSDHFQEIAWQFGAPDLAIMECGQYGENWHSVHMYPEESVEVCRILGAKLSIPVHWGAYVLSDHAWDDPPRRFRLRAEELGIPHRIPTLYELITIRK